MAEKENYLLLSLDNYMSLKVLASQSCKKTTLCTAPVLEMFHRLPVTSACFCADLSVTCDDGGLTRPLYVSLI